MAVPAEAVCPHCCADEKETDASAARWYVAQHHQTYGPYTWKRLLALALHGDLDPEVMLFKEGTTRWVRAGTLRALFSPPPAKPVAALTAPSPRARSSRVAAARPSNATAQPKRAAVSAALVAWSGPTHASAAPAQTAPRVQVRRATVALAQPSETSAFEPAAPAAQELHLVIASTTMVNVAIASHPAMPATPLLAAPAAAVNNVAVPESCETQPEVPSADGPTGPAAADQTRAASPVVEAEFDHEPAWKSLALPALFGPGGLPRLDSQSAEAEVEDEPRAEALAEAAPEAAAAEPLVTTLAAYAPEALFALTIPGLVTETQASAAEADPAPPAQPMAAAPGEVDDKAIPWLVEALVAATISVLLSVGIALGYCCIDWSGTKESQRANGSSAVPAAQTGADGSETSEP
jgi:hypothetical protein